MPNNISGKPAPFKGDDPAYFLNFNEDSALTISTRGNKGWVWVYIIEIATGIGLILLYYFVALPGFEKWFKHSPNPAAPVAGLSATYFLIAGLFEAYVVNPILVKYIVKATRTGAHTDNSMINLAKAVYWAMVVGFYIVLMKSYLEKRKMA